MSTENTAAVPRQTLSVMDACAMIVGLIVGAGMFGTPSIVAGAVGGESTLYAVWIAGGIFSIIGALCYAELATAFPSPGGEYHFIQRAFGNSLAFLYGWARMTVIVAGAVGDESTLYAVWIAGGILMQKRPLRTQDLGRLDNEARGLPPNVRLRSPPAAERSSRQP